MCLLDQGWAEKLTLARFEAFSMCFVLPGGGVHFHSKVIGKLVVFFRV